MDYAISTRAAENRTRWKGIVANSSVMPRQAGWSGGAMVLVPGRPTILMTVGQGPIVLAVGAGGGWFGHFYSPLSSLSLSLGDGLI